MSERRYMTVEYFGEKGFKVVSNDYPRSLEDCAKAVERLRQAHTGSARFGIVELVELTAFERPAIVVDWLHKTDEPADNAREIKAGGLNV